MSVTTTDLMEAAKPKNSYLESPSDPSDPAADDLACDSTPFFDGAECTGASTLARPAAGDSTPSQAVESSPAAGEEGLEK